MNGECKICRLWQWLRPPPGVVSCVAFDALRFAHGYDMVATAIVLSGIFFSICNDKKSRLLIPLN